jgi:hypothetical protein
LVIAGSTGGGLLVGLAVLGLALLLIGVGAAIVHRARWAFIANRKIRAAVAAAGLVMLVVVAATAPPTAPAATRLARPGRPSIGVGQKNRARPAPVTGWHPSPVHTSDPDHS